MNVMDRTAAFAAPQKPIDHPPVKAGRVGVLLMNLGTPEGTTYWPMRRYLKEFLSDRRVIEAPRALWWPVLNLIILSTRPKRKGRDYDTIWNKERDEGPLKTITRSQAEQLAGQIKAVAGDRVRPGISRSHGHALAAHHPGVAPLFRRPGLYRRSRIVDETRSGETCL